MFAAVLAAALTINSYALNRLYDQVAGLRHQVAQLERPAAHVREYRWPVVTSHRRCPWAG